jgi:D-alanyl-D-alanine carboxypeptidase (penicillin-binding protein 5/6)
MKKIIKVVSFFVLLSIVLTLGITVTAAEQKNENAIINAKSAVLMDANTGTLLFEMNKDERLPPASVTKIMTLLLVFEALENNVIKLDNILQVSENAASMGGSQIFLEPGEKMSVEDLIKSVVIASANDAAVTLAEHIGGSEEAFVYSMNKRAKELGMNNTYFENATGLDDDTTMHLTTAYDIALMSRELLKHEKIMEYTTIWMDTVRNGAFGLSNTNKLIRFYKGATGLKTGSTSKAGFCISATAKRKNLHLISVIMGSETSQVRNASATKLLDLGFAKYEIFFKDDINIDPIKVCGGKKDYINAVFDSKEIIIPKSKSHNVEIAISTKEVLNAPVKKGEVVGSIIYKLDGEIIDEAEIYSSESVDEIDFIWYLGSILKKIIIN